MSLEFGTSLSRDRKGLASELSHGPVGGLARSFKELNERVIILCKEDIHAETPEAPTLDWSALEKGEIAVQLKDTNGLDEGSVTIKASTLQRIHPALLPIRLEAEYLFPISLKTVVLQVQPDVRQSSERRPEQVNPDFDTPIAQVAREDEGYFKLAKVADRKETPAERVAQAKRKVAGPVLTPADRPSFPMERRNFFAESKDSGHTLPTRAEKPPPQSPCPKPEVEQAEHAVAKMEAIAQGSLRRFGLERLREIFMTEDELDVCQVAHLLAAFPKVHSAIVVLGDGTVLGGSVPDGYDPEAARLAPVIMRSVREFNRRLRSSETAAFTLLADRPVTLFAEGNVHILISHEGRGLLPGMRERIGEVARALDALLMPLGD